MDRPPDHQGIRVGEPRQRRHDRGHRRRVDRRERVVAERFLQVLKIRLIVQPRVQCRMSNVECPSFDIRHSTFVIYNPAGRVVLREIAAAARRSPGGS